MESNAEIRPVTALRFIAAVIVYVFHMHARWPVPAPEGLSRLVQQGAVGMSLFFVLSGFVLALRYRVPAATREYFVNRFARIYPVYLLGALLSLPFLLSQVQFFASTPAVMTVQTVLIVLANIFLLQAWFPQMFPLWNINGSWSISAEAFFYALFPGLLRALEPAANRTLVGVAAGATVLASLPGLVHFILPNPTAFAVYYAIPVFRIPEFIVGLCCGLLFIRGVRVSLLSGVALTIGFVVYILALPEDYFPAFTIMTHSWLTVPAIALTIWGAASLSAGSLAHRVLGSGPLVYLGRISYSFYSIQLVLLLMLYEHHGDVVAYVPALKHNGLLCLAGMAVLVAASSLCFHLVEEPSRRWISRRWRNPPPTPAPSRAES